MLALAFAAGILCLLISLGMPFHFGVIFLFFGMALVILMIGFDQIPKYLRRRRKGERL
jgi:hypothetical protein